MRYRIDEISNEVSTGETYVLVSFWETEASRLAGDPPYLVNDFLMTLRDQGTRIVTNRDGWYKRASDGVFIDPATLAEDDRTEWERETYTIDAPAIVEDNIAAYIRRAEANDYSGDHTGDATKPFRIAGVVQPQRESQLFVRDAVDRNGATNRVDVQALKVGIRGSDRVRAIQGGSR